MKLKVTTQPDLTPEQRDVLRLCGCSATPYLCLRHTWTFAATCNDEQEEVLGGLSYVVDIKPMSIYGFA